MPGRNATSYTSLPPRTNSSEPISRPAFKSTRAMPAEIFACRLRTGGALRMCFRRIFERPTRAKSFTKLKPRVNPGSEQSSSQQPVCGSNVQSEPYPELQNHHRPLCQRGECGMQSPPTTTLFCCTSTTTPLLHRFCSRQPPSWPVSQKAVAIAGRPSFMPSPLRWHRSREIKPETNDGCQQWTK